MDGTPPPAPPTAAPGPALLRRPLALALLVGAVPPLVAVLQLGRLHPDEVYQHLEPALHRAFGYGVLAWEWQVGLRNWAVPGLFALLLKAGDALGVHDAWSRRALLALPQWLLHAAMLLAVYRLTLRRVGEVAARRAVPLVGLYFVVLAWAGRTMGESLSAAFIVWGLERLDDREAKPEQTALGGALLGLSVVARYGSAVFAASAVAWLLLQRRFRAAALASAGGVLVALALGALDQATWGDWFHSLKAYVEFNVTSGKAAAQFGASPAWFYLPHLLWLAPWAVWGLGASVRVAGGRVGTLVFPALCYVAALSATAHKEERFLVPALVVLAVAGTVGFLAFLERGPSPGVRKVAWALCALGLVVPHLLRTPFDVQRPEQFRLLVKAGREATGVLVVNEGVWGAGGSFYLGRNIPWATCDFAHEPRFQAAVQSPQVNRAVTWDQRANAELIEAGFRVLETLGPATLLGR